MRHTIVHPTAMNLALFDFDGTITRGDTWTGFLRFSTSPQRALIAGILLSPLIVGYKMRWVSARTARPIVAQVAFRGRSSARMHDLGRRYASEILPGVLRQEALDRLDWHKRRDDEIVIVSAALDVYLTYWCESMSVDVICTRLEEERGHC